ncbi:hypothetical protein K458DRAFT_411270 [Lentithecium fluviatile CBS 122367]|uniref:Uncharacterized protein n=1 Tax=Lentithecium fluviatile CBS 122367 TaxID=1168545 RepID=A0A6G1JLU8_9PLEO|nr:hypothetical protein K458DRAFT_411270 [Lentithecium fluviatile CBS 122367]
MASRRAINSGPSRYATSRDHDDHPESEEEPIGLEHNNRRLRQAIRYLNTEGGPDPPAEYINRVQDIQDAIIKQYREASYPHDPQLYRQLRSLVREVQNNFQRVIGEESTADLEDSDASIEDLFTPDAFNREEEDQELTPPDRRAHRSATLSPPPAGPRKAEVLKTQYLYGGPDNEVEEWHKDFPAALSFGETLYMQGWESVKIDYDLAESAKKSADDPNHVVTTNVPYSAVEARFGTPNQYESGSRFKIPGKVWDMVKKLTTSPSSLTSIVDEFNEGGDLQEQKNKDYAPRVFLPQISLVPRPHTSPNACGKQPIQVKSPPSAATDDDLVFDGINESFSTPTPTVRQSFVPRPTPKSKLSKSALRKFDERRIAVTGISPTPPPTQPDTTPRTKSKEPTPARLQYVRAGSSTARKPGRPRKDSVAVASPAPSAPSTAQKPGCPRKDSRIAAAPPAPSASATRSGRKRKSSDTTYVPEPASPSAASEPSPTVIRVRKRKRSHTEYVPSPTEPRPPVRKTKTTAAAAKVMKTRAVKNVAVKTPAVKAPAVKAPAAKKPVLTKLAVKKSVAFASKETPPPVTRSTPKKTLAVKKSAIKRKVKEAGSVPEVLAKDVQKPDVAVGAVTRGMMRSGVKVK